VIHGVRCLVKLIVLNQYVGLNILEHDTTSDNPLNLDRTAEVRSSILLGSTN